MKIKTVEYAGTIVNRGGEAPERLPQIAFSGRSNVGKSSLINAVLKRTRRKMAHVSSTPGKTQALNFFRVNNEFFLVDLPGYGYAQVPVAIRDAWTETIEWYLAESEELRGVVHLVDARHKPPEHDLRMVSYLADLRLPTLVVLTKVDKLRRNERQSSVARALDILQLDESQLLPFSSKTGEGRDSLLHALTEILSGAPATP